jgi:predicted nuclease of predicted toxin-antitoxin system
VKLLFDQNLSHKLVRRLADLFPKSVQVRQVGLKEAGDPLVWEYAKNNGLVFISKDSDFHQRSFLYGYPPKVVWVRLGNCSTADVERVLRANFDHQSFRRGHLRSVPQSILTAQETGRLLAARWNRLTQTKPLPATVATN